MLRLKFCLLSLLCFALVANSSRAQESWPPTKDSARNAAIEWLRSANKFGPDHAIVSDMTQVIDEAFGEDMNINLFFGSDLMDSGKFQTLHLFCHQALSFDMTPEQAAAMGLENLSVTTTTSGSMGTPADKPSFELSQLVVRNADKIGKTAKFNGKIRCKALSDAASGEFALRVSYRGSAGVSQFKYLDSTPSEKGDVIEFEFGPLNEEGNLDEKDSFVGPVAAIFDIVTVDQSGGDVKVLMHSKAIGTIITVQGE